MTNRKSYGVFIALVLVTTLSLGIGSRARADDVRSGRTHASTTTLSWSVPKPVPGPYSGEPDAGSSGPLPPKNGPYATPRGAVVSWWTRIQTMMWMALGHRTIP
jgi:hypothetical protein